MGNKMTPEKITSIIDSHSSPRGGGLLGRLKKKDKELSELYDLQHPFRSGFLLAEEIVRKWIEETHP